MIHTNTDCYTQEFKKAAPLQNDKGYTAYWKAKALTPFQKKTKPMFCRNDNPNTVVQQSFKYI